MSRGRRRPKQESGFYEAYAGFARSLRTWFIAYGIGAPVVFLTNPNAWNVIATSGEGRCIALLFLGGVALQILATILYKTAMWYLYVDELDGGASRNKAQSFWERVSVNYRLEMAFDVVTLVLFGAATWKTLALFA